jgi:hypothetical protein
MISEYTVAWVAAESRYGWELALEWIESAKRKYCIRGLGCLVKFSSYTGRCCTGYKTS